MQPEKYIRDLESSGRREKLFQHIFVSIVFLAFFLFMGALIHEISHMAVLEWKSCPYFFSWNFSVLDGLTAGVKPLCALGSSSLLFFYSVGYLSTLLAGALLMVTAIESGREFVQRYFSAAGTGMLLSVLLSIGSKGDFRRGLEVLGLESFSSLAVIFVTLGVILSSLKGAQMLLELEGQE